jgi:hypothetical protein
LGTATIPLPFAAEEAWMSITGLQWLGEAADHLKAFSQYFLHDVRVRSCTSSLRIIEMDLSRDTHIR